MKTTIAAAALAALLSASSHAQVSSRTGSADAKIAETLSYSRSVNPEQVKRALTSLPNRSPEQLATNAAQLKSSLFGLRERDPQTESVVGKAILPLLTELQATQKVIILGIKEDQIPYARITKDGVFVVTRSMVAQESLSPAAKGIFLREVARLHLAGEYGSALSIAEPKALEEIDLKITAAAAVLSRSMGVDTGNLRRAILTEATLRKGAPSTYETDIKLFPASAAVAVKPMFNSPLLNQGRQKRNATAMTTNGVPAASTDQHDAVIGALQSSKL